MMVEAGRAVVIGNSDGIGLALTRRLLDLGWRVVGLSRSPSPITDPGYHHETVDVTAADYPAALGRALDRLDRIDLCVYAAGTGTRGGVTETAAQTRTLRVNLLGAAETVDAVVPRMIAVGGGHLVALSSLSDVLFDGATFGYSASKAGLSTYLYGLAMALRPHGIAVTNVRFGFVDTKMGDGPVRPLLISADRAAEVVVRSLRRRPAVVSYPRRMAVLVRLVRAALAVRLRLGGPAGG